MTLRRILLGFMLMASPTVADEPLRSWHLLQTQADGGIAAILHGLTKDECEFAKNRIEGQPATPSEMEAQKAQIKIEMETICPENTKEAWAKWQDGHLGATGCQQPNGGAVVWGGGRSYSPHDVITAECFQ